MSERDPGHLVGVLLVLRSRLHVGLIGYAICMSMLTAAGVFATGYVLGARAGRERYDEIRRTLERLTADPRIKEVVIKVEERAMNHYNDVPPSGDGIGPADRAEHT